MKEVFVEDTEVGKAIVGYINVNRISNVVLGASSRSAISRLVRCSHSSSFLH